MHEMYFVYEIIGVKPYQMMTYMDKSPPLLTQEPLMSTAPKMVKDLPMEANGITVLNIWPLILGMVIIYYAYVYFNQYSMYLKSVFEDLMISTDKAKNKYFNSLQKSSSSSKSTGDEERQMFGERFYKNKIAEEYLSWGHWAYADFYPLVYSHECAKRIKSDLDRATTKSPKKGTMPKSKKVLIIDDDPNILQLLKNLLKKKGYDISTASNGISGLLEFEKKHPELILMDLNMPQMNGITAGRIIKENKKGKDVNIIGITTQSKMDRKYKKHLKFLKYCDDIWLKDSNKQTLLELMENLRHKPFMGTC